MAVPRVPDYTDVTLSGLDNLEDGLACGDSHYMTEASVPLLILLNSLCGRKAQSNKYECKLWSLVLFLAAATIASDPAKNSSIEGFVTLNGAAYLAGVTIGVANQASGGHFEVRTNKSGYYVFEDIRPGAYTIWADAQGYGCILIPRLALHYSERVRQDFDFVRGKARQGCEAVDTKKSN